jgi:competence protein ComEC
VTLAFVAFAWLLGISAAALTGANPAALVAAASLLSAASFAASPKPATLVLIALALLAVAGAGWRYSATERTPPANAISSLNGDAEVRFRAVVADEPDDRLTSRLYRLDSRQAFVRGGWRDMPGGILMRTAPNTAFEYGDLIEVKGVLETPPEVEGFDYREHLARQGVRSVVAYPSTRLLDTGMGNTLKSEVIEARQNLTRALEKSLPEPESSLAAGILLGSRGALPRDLKSDMDASGTSHLVAVSGQNVALLAGLVIASLAWLIGRRPACLAALLAIVSYSFLVGAEASVVRAAIMGGLYITAIAVGRQNSGWGALLLAGALMTAHDPQIVHDLSFQLSFAAVLGLATVAVPLREQIEARLLADSRARSFPITRPVLDSLCLSLAATAFTIPITAVNFHQVSLVSPVANLFVLPAFLAVAATAAVAAVLGSIFPNATELLGWLAWPPAAYMVTVVGLFGNLPGASIRLEGVGLAHAIAYYAALGAAILYVLRRRVPVPEPVASTRVNLRIAPAAAAIYGLIALSAVVVWLGVQDSSMERLSVTFMDVGQGEAILIESPTGNRVLVDGGPSGEAITGALGRRLPFYEDAIDLVVLTHLQSDHLGGLPAVLERFDVGAVVQTPNASASGLHGAWEQSLERTGTPVIQAGRGQLISLGGGVSLTILSPADYDRDLTENESSIVAKLQFGSVSMLLTGDIGKADERRLASRGVDLQADVLKVAHHGSGTSSSDEFLDRVKPHLAVISVGEANRFGHPDARTLARLDGLPVFRTDEDGDIVVSTDGTSVWVETGH